MQKFQSRTRFLTWSTALLLIALATSCGGSGGRDPILGIGNFGPVPPAPDTTRPTVIFTVPANAATGVATNTRIIATFSEDMNPATVTAPGTFTLCDTGAVLGGTCVTTIAGTVSYAANARTAVFTPTLLPLASNANFKATVSGAATDLAGNTLTAGSVPNPWSFTTGAVADSTAPTVTLVNPPDLATGVCRQQSVSATFSENMDPSTITTVTFTLQVTAGPGPVLGATVTYDAPSRVATLNPTSDLLANTDYTATVTTGVEDLAGNALAANEVWTFATGTLDCLMPVALGTAAPFGTMGGSAGMTNQGTLTVINGDIGSTAVSTAVTGFHDNSVPYTPPPAAAGCTYTETPSNIGNVNGNIYTAPPSPTIECPDEGTAETFAIAQQALDDARAAYNALAGLAPGANPGGNLAGLTLFPGVYTAPAGSFLIEGGDLTLDGQGDANAVWVFQMASTLTVGGPGAAAPQSVILINGAQAKNVFWQVGSAAGGGTMVCTLIAQDGAAFSTAGNVMVVTLNGRALSLNASVTLVNTIINVPAP
jgi:hypothetical protein